MAVDPLPEPGDDGAVFCSCGHPRHYLHPEVHDVLVCPKCDQPDPPKK